MGAYGKPLRILIFLASMLSNHPAKTGMFPVPLLFKRQETHNMVDLRPRIALISCNTAARLLSTCTKCEESRANGIGRPPAWIPLLLSGFDIFAIKKFTYSITYETARARTMFSAKSITVRNPSTRLSPITSTELPLSRSSTSRPKLHSVWIRSRQ